MPSWPHNPATRFASAAASGRAVIDRGDLEPGGERRAREQQQREAVGAAGDGKADPVTGIE